MAQIASSFKCLVCGKPLLFPENIDITEFTILFLQFYKTHDACEKADKNKELKKAVDKVTKKKKR